MGKNRYKTSGIFDISIEFTDLYKIVIFIVGTSEMSPQAMKY